MAHRSRSSAPVEDRADKVCAVCGRTITWRAKWARDWPQVRHCSDACRARARSGAGEREELEAALRERLARCSAGTTACPSEVARAVHAARGGSGDGWRDLMEPVRQAARRLAADGELEITQNGVVVDPSRAKGPVRLRPVR
ncbi:DUF2256 and DUF3253 domain-containing protein [Rhodococcus antarcticus]|uniref:DUF2256 and DUF3253 domain-containing protein n=1 Tax=Rhodococcus antarcticus TaxID=2987751 RepID=UPI00338FF4FD